MATSDFHLKVLVSFDLLTAEEAKVVERHREEKRLQEERERVRRQADASRAAKARRLHALLSGTTWEQADGTRIEVSKMTPRHASNALRFARGRTAEFDRLRAYMPGLVRPVTPSRWPLIEALTARAVEEPSLRDRLVDRRNRRQYEKKRSAR